MSAELKPCPFCGGSTQRVKSSARWGYFVSCACGAVGPSSATSDTARQAWNTRKEPRQQQLPFV